MKYEINLKNGWSAKNEMSAIKESREFTADLSLMNAAEFQTTPSATSKVGYWAAIVHVNPEAKFGMDRKFLPNSRSELFAFNFSDIQEGHQIEVRQTVPNSGKYNMQCGKFFRVVSVSSERIELEEITRKELN